MTQESSTVWETAVQISLEALGGLALLLAGFVGALGRYHVKRLDSLITEVGTMREKYITREELIATLARSEQAISQRHQQSMDYLGRIEGKIEANAKESKDDRRDMYNVVNATAREVSALTGKQSASAEIAEAITKVLSRSTS